MYSLFSRIQCVINETWSCQHISVFCFQWLSFLLCTSHHRCIWNYKLDQLFTLKLYNFTYVKHLCWFMTFDFLILFGDIIVLLNLYIPFRRQLVKLILLCYITFLSSTIKLLVYVPLVYHHIFYLLYINDSPFHSRWGLMNWNKKTSPLINHQRQLCETKIIDKHTYNKPSDIIADAFISYGMPAKTSTKIK